MSQAQPMPPNSTGGVVLELCGDHHGHTVILSRDDVPLVWDDVSRVLTIHGGVHSEQIANELYWAMARIVPALRDDRR